tara:strand:+ start:735 stop:1196 length:462 start_codon:yes stop_codon:yes gene_type:complete
MILKKKEILEYQKNRDPYLMIDEATEVVPGKLANGFKILGGIEDEWFFQVHWPGDPNMPGMLQIEAMTQMCALSILTLPGNKGKTIYLSSANNLKFIHKILPRSKFEIFTKVKSFNRGIAICNGEGKVKNLTVCKADFVLILPDELKKYKISK